MQATITETQTIRNWTDFIGLILVTINKAKSPSDLEVAEFFVELKEWKKVQIKATVYVGPEIGEKFHTPLNSEQRVGLKDCLKTIMRDTSRHFVTESKTGEKLYWEASLAN